MALQSSGAISLNDIQTEFGGTNPISISEYYRGGAFVTGNNTGVPTSGEIALSDFYGAAQLFTHTITSNQEEINLATYLTAQGWTSGSPIVLTINSGVYIWSDNTSVAALTIPSSLNGLLTVTNNGFIIGKGGNGGSGSTAGGNGGDAIANFATGVTWTNASGSYIAGGGGGGGGGTNAGGGGGAGGGAGGSYGGYAGGAGGAVGAVGSDGAFALSGSLTGAPARGGGRSARKRPRPPPASARRARDPGPRS